VVHECTGRLPDKQSNPAERLQKSAYKRNDITRSNSVAAQNQDLLGISASFINYETPTPKHVLQYQRVFITLYSTQRHEKLYTVATAAARWPGHSPTPTS